MNRFALRLAIVCGVGLFGCQANKSGPKPDAQSAAKVQTGAIVRQSEPTLVRAQATVVADPRHVSRLSSTEAQPVLAVAVRVGDTVSRGQLLVELADDPQARATAGQADIQLATAKRTLAREEALVKGGVEPRMNADEARAQYAMATVQAQAARSLLSRMEADTHLRAPTQGVVVDVSAAVGQVVNPGADLVDIADPRHLVARLQIEPADLDKVRPGQRATLWVPDANQSFAAHITRVAATLDPQSQLGEADAELLGPHPSLGIGRFLVADVTVGTTDDLLVPASALVHRDSGDVVYLLANGKAQEVAVLRGPRYGDRVAVRAKLIPGAMVVTTGAYELSDGDPVTVAVATGSAR